MKYIAKEDVGEYKKGQEVPEELALTWVAMFKYPPVEKIESQSISEPKKESNSLDLNGDGKVDKKDASIAGKVLKAHSKGNKR